MSTVMLNIILRAVKARVAAGEDIEDVLDSYPKLTSSERKTILAQL